MLIPWMSILGFRFHFWYIYVRYRLDTFNILDIKRMKITLHNSNKSLNYLINKLDLHVPQLLLYLFPVPESNIFSVHINHVPKLIRSSKNCRYSQKISTRKKTERLTSIIVESNRFDPVQKREDKSWSSRCWKNNEYLGIDGLKDREAKQVDDHNSPRRCPSTLQSFVSIFQGRFPTRKRFEPFKSYVCFGTCAPSLSRPPAAPSSLQPPSRLFTQATGNISCHPPIRPADGGWVKEHPFGVCDACRWPCTGKSRVAALNCTVAPNTCPTTGQTFDRPTPIKPMTFSDTDDNGNAAFSLPCIL